MRPDIPFWTWVVARRVPVFALVVTLIMLAGASLISRHVHTYMSTAELMIDPRLAKSQGLDSQSHFEFLKFRALTSAALEEATSEIPLYEDPLSRVQINHDPRLSKITIGYRDPNPETALVMTRAISKVILVTAASLSQDNAAERVNQFKTEAKALHDRLGQLEMDLSAPQRDVELRLTGELYQTAIANLASAKADLENPPQNAVSISRQPTLAESPTGPNQKSMYLALISFAIFCGLVAILILEWLDTVIRRPHDIETTLGFATFGVIPDLQLQPIEPHKNSKRAI